MAKQPNKPPPRLALFDRLLQGDSIETDRNPDRALRELREAVRRDLEILLNTRASRLATDLQLPELGQSILAYGLPEADSQHLATPAQQQAFRVTMQNIIKRFEPRFRDLSVELVTADNQVDRVLRFRISAILVTDSTSESVAYDMVIDPLSGVFLT